MSYFLAFGLDDESLVDGPDLATIRGWASFIAWTDTIELSQETYPVIHLAEHGGWWSAENEAGQFSEGLADDEEAQGDTKALAELEQSLDRLIKQKPGKPSKEALSVARALLSGLRQRPPRAIAVVVTDGTEGDDEGDEEDDEA
jgi:hypothetical protein